MKIILGIVLVGITAGLSGMSVAMILHAIQHAAYGTNSNGFLAEVTTTTHIHRLLVLISCGLVGGIGWFALKRYGQTLVSIAESMQPSLPKTPLLSTLLSDLLQVTTVALGSPLGREVAPRELGALFAGRISSKLGLSVENTQILIACGAGAGLGAVYNVPLSGALFASEVLLRRFDWRVVVTALLTSIIAVTISWIGLGNEPQYRAADFAISGSLIVWSLLVGPILWFAGKQFGIFAKHLRNQAPRDGKIILFCFMNFLVVGILAMYFPALLGNGKSAAGLEFADLISIQTGLILLGLRLLITLSSVRAGAMGGLLTPSMAIGALAGAVLGATWSLAWPGSPVGTYALMGAAIFLGASQKMPITAVMLMIELTHAYTL